MKINIYTRIALIITILVGISRQPYAYYEFLRVFVFLVSIFLCIESFKKTIKNGFEYLYLCIAILFNPIFPIYMSKEVWVIFDWASAILIGISLFIDKEKQD
jgi:FtsH-binding integral membrane protein